MTDHTWLSEIRWDSVDIKLSPDVDNNSCNPQKMSINYVLQYEMTWGKHWTSFSVFPSHVGGTPRSPQRKPPTLLKGQVNLHPSYGTGLYFVLLLKKLNSLMLFILFARQHVISLSAYVVAHSQFCSLYRTQQSSIPMPSHFLDTLFKKKKHRLFIQAVYNKNISFIAKSFLLQNNFTCGAAELPVSPLSMSHILIPSHSNNSGAYRLQVPWNTTL